MTFKHMKFEDSPTMRALEKVAKEKGLVKEEPLQKQASAKKVDYTPTGNFVENILKLCSGLRSKGLVKLAEDLELNFTQYKQAQTLYETSKETGDDLVEFAHPKGSHKLEGIEGDEAVIEDILDAHKKHLEMVNKKPTGKLSNASQIIKEVKKVLAQSNDPKSLLISAYNLVQQALEVSKKSGGLSDSVMNWSNDRAAVIAKSAQKDDITLNDAKDAEDAINALLRNLHPNLLHNYLPEILNKGISTDAIWTKVEGFLNNALAYTKEAQDKIITQNISPTGGQSTVTTLNELTPEESALGPLYRRIGTLKQKLQSYKLIGAIARNSGAMTWINEEIKGLDELAGRLQQVPENLEAEMSKQLAPEVMAYEKDVAQFASQWVQSR